MDAKKGLVIFSVIFGICTIGFILLKTEKYVFVYDGFGVRIPNSYPIMGIDVSHHQGDIDYEAAVQMHGGEDSIQFVYIKATEGSNFKDTRYDQNAEGFAAFKMKYGFYHYFQPDVSATKQALFYCQTIKNYNFKLIPVVDIEVIGNRSKRQIVDSIACYLDKVENILQVRPMVYTYVSFYKDYFKGTKIANELFWLAAYNPRNEYMEMENAIIWQFSEKGTVNGIATKVDMNVAKASFMDKVVRKL